MAQTWNESVDLSQDRLIIRRITFHDLTESLRLGWVDFIAAPTQIIFLCLIYPFLGSRPAPPLPSSRWPTCRGL